MIPLLRTPFFFFFFFFNDTATTEIYTLSLHDALPISMSSWHRFVTYVTTGSHWTGQAGIDRKSTRLNSSHSQISYAVFCLKKKKYSKFSRYSASIRRQRIHAHSPCHYTPDTS